MKTELNYPDYVDNVSLEERLGEGGISMMEKKYIPRDKQKNLIQNSAQRIYTVARELASVEEKYGASPEKVDEITKTFYDVMSNLEFLPGGRILANIATDIKALLNCYVLPVEDDLESIYQTVAKAAKIHKNGGGTGYNFSRIRPRGYEVKNGVASGPVSFAGQFDKETEVINSGNRRGANMGILNVDHPDIFDFIRSKYQQGQLTNFNLSVGMSDEFMEAYKSDRFYKLRYEGKEVKAEELLQLEKNLELSQAGADVGKKVIPPTLQIRGDEVYNVFPVLDENKNIIYDGQEVMTDSEKVGRVTDGYVEINPKKLLNMIASIAHKRAEPGIIFLDTINKNNLMKDAYEIESTNPCGEQPLPPYGGCDLGSINLTRMLKETKKGYQIDYDKIDQMTRVGMRMLDNVNDLNQGPIPEIEEHIRDNRRTGLGVTGWGDMLYQLDVAYDSEDALKLASKVMGFIQKTALDESKNLAKEKGAFALFEKSEMYKENPDELYRNAGFLSIAPTGSISSVMGIIHSTGLEPIFALSYVKKTRGGDKTTVGVPAFEKAITEAGLDLQEILEKVKNNKGSCQGISEVPEDIQRVFRTSMDMAPEYHIKMQAEFQKYVDSAISKTINLPRTATIDDVLNSYVLAHELGCKGVTVYVDNTLDTQVLNLEDESQVQKIQHMKERPEILPGFTIKTKTGCGSMFTTVNYDEGKLREVFLTMGKAGGCASSQSETLGRIISTYLGQDLDLDDLMKQLVGIRCNKPFGLGQNEVLSCSDGVGKTLTRVLQEQKDPNSQDSVGKVVKKIKHLSSNTDLSIKSNGEKSIKKIHEIINEDQSLAGTCSECGSVMIKQEGCAKCTSCGNSNC